MSPINLYITLVLTILLLMVTGYMETILEIIIEYYITTDQLLSYVFGGLFTYQHYQYPVYLN